MGKKRVLLVDDEALVLELTETMLEALDYPVTSFECAEGALDAFKKDIQGYDVVITDQSMPAMSGVELAEKIRGLREDIPVIISTGHSGQQIQEQIEGLKGCFVLEKPFNLDQLENLVESV